MPIRKFGLPLFFGFFIFSLANNPGFANTDPQALLERVKADIASRHAASLEHRFSYNMDILVSGSESYQVSLSYDPSLPRAQQWEILSPSIEQNEDVFKETKKQIDNDATKSPDAKDDRDLILENFPLPEDADAVFIGEENGIARFEFALTDEFMAMDGDDSSHEMGKLSKHLSGELAIDTNTEQLLWLRMYSKKPFKPVAIAKIKEFDIQLYFEPAWQGGPIVQMRTQSNVSGSALFKKFVEKSEMKISTIERK